MSELSAEPLASDREAVPASSASRRVLVWTAWISTLLLSYFPLIIARELMGGDIPWISTAWVVTAGLLIAAAFAWPALRPLWRYFAILGVIFLAALLDPVLRGLPLFRGSLASETAMTRIFAERIVLLIQVLPVLAALFLLGVKRREAFLTPGRLNAPFGGDDSPARRRRLTWAVVGPLASLGIAGLFLFFLLAQTGAALPALSAALPWLPLILLNAALNGFREEAQFRAAPLSTLLPVVGRNHAIWITSVWFGVMHYYGAFPSGPFGLVQAGALALLMGSAMIDTRGIGWPWIIHTAIDTVIFIFMAASLI